MAKTVQRLAWLVLLGLGLFLTGCGGVTEVRYPETGATLEGTVTYGNDKIGLAMIVARNQSGQANAFVDDDGHYKLENVPLGEVQLGVNTDAGKGVAKGRAMQQAGGKAKAIPPMIEVPNRFHDPDTSGIKTTINKGQNAFDIVIPR